MGKWIVFVVMWLGLANAFASSENESLPYKVYYNFQCFCPDDEQRMKGMFEETQAEVAKLKTENPEMDLETYLETVNPLSKSLIPQILSCQSALLRYVSYRELLSIYYEPVLFRIAYNLALIIDVVNAKDIPELGYKTIASFSFDDATKNTLIRDLERISEDEQFRPFYSELENGAWVLSKLGLPPFTFPSGTKSVLSAVKKSAKDFLFSSYTLMVAVTVPAFLYFMPAV
ncbi:MAG: hypothetical protein KBB83_02335 [Alphaproteobacteria bacterium]|nr:hypothetical protein [Alphaproteobacteria bacterium]